MLLSWTSQLVGGGLANGIYEIQFAVVEFDIIHPNPDDDDDADPASAGNVFPTPTGSNRQSSAKVSDVREAVQAVLDIVQRGGCRRDRGRGSGSFGLMWMDHVVLFSTCWLLMWGVVQVLL